MNDGEKFSKVTSCTVKERISYFLKRAKGDLDVLSSAFLFLCN
jgi:hypothetical protein